MLRALSLAEVGLVTYLWSVTMLTCLQTMSADDKKVRPANLTAAENEFLIKLALKYQAVIENKKSNEATAYLSCVQNSNNNELSSSIIVEFYCPTRHIIGQIFMNLTVSKLLEKHE